MLGVPNLKINKHNRYIGGNGICLFTCEKIVFSGPSLAPELPVAI